jgi:hypothetical protein
MISFNIQPRQRTVYDPLMMVIAISLWNKGCNKMLIA